jgi:hypothetical protein
LTRIRKRSKVLLMRNNEAPVIEIGQMVDQRNPQPVRKPRKSSYHYNAPKRPRKSSYHY